jgi:hypothetical protein
MNDAETRKNNLSARSDARCPRKILDESIFRYKVDQTSLSVHTTSNADALPFLDLLAVQLRGLRVSLRYLDRQLSKAFN